MAPMRVVHITEASAAGVRLHLRRIVPGLRSRGIEIGLILSALRADPDLQADVDLYRTLGCRVDLCPMRHGLAPLHDILAMRQVRRLVRAQAPAVVHAHATKAGLIARPAVSGLGGVRTVYSPHAFCFDAFPAGFRRRLAVGMERWLAQRTDRFAFVSETEKRDAVGLCHADEARIRVIPNGLPADFAAGLLPRDRARQEWGIPPEAVLVGVPGRLCRQKGQDWLLGALARLDLTGLGLRICFCGTGPDEVALQIACRRLGLALQVTWLGYVPDLPRRWRAFDLVVLPSRYEGLSYVLLETLAAGVPLIVSDIPANFPRPEWRGRLRAVPVGDEHALAAAIAEFAETRGEWAETARELAADVGLHFRLDAQVAQLAACYAECASPDPHPARG